MAHNHVDVMQTEHSSAHGTNITTGANVEFLLKDKDEYGTTKLLVEREFDRVPVDKSEFSVLLEEAKTALGQIPEGTSPESVSTTSDGSSI